MSRKASVLSLSKSVNEGISPGRVSEEALRRREYAGAEGRTLDDAAEDAGHGGGGIERRN